MAPGEDALPLPLGMASSAERVLREGETILLALRPSVWYVLLSSLPVLVVAGLLGGSLLLLDPGPDVLNPTVRSGLWFALAAVSGLRLLLSALRWWGLLYVLTNLRVIRMGGVVYVDVRDCPLRDIEEVQVLAAPAERMLGLGSVVFTVEGRLAGELGWTHLARPDDVATEVCQAIRNMRGR